MNLPTLVDARDNSGRPVIDKSTTLEDSYRVWKHICLVKLLSMNAIVTW